MLTLKKLKYSEFANDPREWSVEEFDLFHINLLVGKNATGKTRTLNVINSLADLLSGRIRSVFLEGTYSAHFTDGQKSYYFELIIKERRIEREVLSIDGNKLLERGEGGKGEIFAAQLKEKIKFQTPENELASVSRRDTIQHPYFEMLNTWGQGTLHYSFGTSLGKDQFMVTRSDPEKTPQFDLKDTGKVVPFFNLGLKAKGEKFKDAIKEKMNSIGYEIEDIEIIKLKGKNISGDLEGIGVKEKGLNTMVTQMELSQGMFRVLSLIIQLEYCRQKTEPSLILIDDIGEGLDFERAVSLVKLLVDEEANPKFQLIMATNDRFVMNNIPLEYWSLIQRNGSHCKIFNHKNSAEKFEEFKFTGLSNFDFLASDFVNKVVQN